jgi:hypothetical protein
MENLSGILGYIASTLVLFTFVAKDMRLLRTVAIEWLPRVLFLHATLLPLNIVRLGEVVRATGTTTGDLTQADGPVSAQNLGADTSRGESSIAPWSIFLGTPKTARPA